jgi:endogenous inhibitor of DNA gyrase (YacG/DUF329 family)
MIRIPSKENQDELKREYEFWGGTYASYKIKCWVCGKEFYSYSPHARYCSYRCKNDANIRYRAFRCLIAREKICAYCNKRFTAKRKDAKYCSKACKQASYRRHVTDKGFAKLSKTFTSNAVNIEPYRRELAKLVEINDDTLIKVRLSHA